MFVFLFSVFFDFVLCTSIFESACIFACTRNDGERGYKRRDVSSRRARDVQTSKCGRTFLELTHPAEGVKEHRALSVSNLFLSGRVSRGGRMSV